MPTQLEPDYHYTVQVLSRAVDALATGRGNLKSRLIDAMVSLSPLSATDFPPDQQKRFREIKRRCNKNPSKQIVVVENGRIYRGPSGSLRATIPYMHWDTVTEIARELVSLEAELRFSLYEAHDTGSR